MPEADLQRFHRLALPEEQIGLAAVLEEGTWRFYRGLAELFRDCSESKLFRDLATAEAKHKAMLASLYEMLTVQPAGTDFPAAVVDSPPDDILEGGMRISEALEWARRHELSEALELGIAVEVQAYDRYLILQREQVDELGRKAFAHLAGAEREHLRRLTELLSKIRA